MSDYLHQLTRLLFTDRRLRTSDNGLQALCSLPKAFLPQTTDYGLPTTVYRMITPEGHTIVEAAHIRPWADSQDDRPANGLALCRLCHWSFDRGFMDVGTDYEVLVSPLARSEQNNPGHIMTLEQRPIFTPEEERHIPDQDCLGWHREEVFRR